MENLVLGGGSIKGITYVGLMKALYEKPDLYDNIKCFAGVSAGAIFATFLYLNISYETLEQFLDIDFSSYLHIDIEHFLEDYGLDSGERYINFLKRVMGDGEMTFKEGYEKTKKRLIISATCLDNYNIEYFDHISHPNLKIIDAIRASMSIPFLFTCVKMDNKRYIDGGLLEPLPISLFDKEKTLGIRIMDKNYNNGYMGDMNTIQGFVYSFAMCVKKRLDYLNNFENKYNILHIYLENISFLDFDINRSKKEEIIDVGYNTVKNYLEKKD